MSMTAWTMTPASIGGTALIALTMALTPGPNMVYLVSRSLAQGWRAGFVSLAGTATGFLTYMTMANLGLAVVFVAVPWTYLVVKAGGAAYLLYLAWRSLRPGGTALFEARDLAPDPPARLFRMGLLTNLLNPKAAIMYLALIPQFVVPDQGHVLVQGFVLGGVQVGISCVVNALVICAAGAIATFLATRPVWLRWQRRIMGTTLGGLAVHLGLSGPARAA